MSKLIFTSFILISLLAILLVPVVVSAQVEILVPCNEVAYNSGGQVVDCNFAKLIELFSNILRWLVWISVPLATVMMVYGGFLMITSPTEAGQRTHAKGIFMSAMIGMIAILAAYLIIDTILTELTGKGVKGRLSSGNVSTMLVSNL